MKFNEVVSVTGVGGLKKIISSRQDGMIVADLDGSNKKFLSSRKHLFSPLENISIYTYDDSVPLQDILVKMQSQPPVDANAKEQELRDYMEQLLPEYDPEKVHKNDIKKLIKWFHILNEHNLIEERAEEEKSEDQGSDS